MISSHSHVPSMGDGPGVLWPPRGQEAGHKDGAGGRGCQSPGTMWAALSRPLAGHTGPPWQDRCYHFHLVDEEMASQRVGSFAQGSQLVRDRCDSDRGMRSPAHFPILANTWLNVDWKSHPSVGPGCMQWCSLNALGACLVEGRAHVCLVLCG